MDDPGNAPPAPPTEETVQAATSAAMRQRIVEFNITLGQTYSGEAKRYCTWVDSEREAGNLPAGEKYLTRTNVDAYFAGPFLDRVMNHNSANRVKCSLQKFADVDEYAGDPEGFVVLSANVKQSIELMDAKHRKKEMESTADPQGSMATDMLTEKEKQTFINHVLLYEKQAWRSLTVTFTICEQMMLRQDSVRKLCYSDLMALLTHTPNPEIDDGYDTRCLAIKYGKFRHKDGQRIDRQIGAWRHKHWLQCSVGMLAFAVFDFLHDNQDINFLRPDIRRKPDWWSLPLVSDWDSTSSAGKSYEAVFNETGMSWAKCCHLRKSATEGATSRAGLSPDLVATMTKHVGDAKTARTMLSIYATELHPDVCLAMSGFMLHGKKFPYLVHRTRLDMTDLHARFDKDPVDIIFPLRQRWIEQRDSLHGDKSRACESLLFEVLPYFAEVIIQDGIYWTRHFPHHPASRRLLSAMPLNAGCPTWADNSVQKIANDELTSTAAAADRLNEAVRDSYNAVLSKLSVVESKLQEERARNLQLEDQRRAREDAEAIERRQLYLMMRQMAQALSQARNVAPPAAAAAAGAAPPPPPPPPPAGDQARRRQVRQLQQRQQRRLLPNAFHVLQGAPRLPTFRTEMPRTIRALVAEFLANNLAAFENMTKNHWTSAMQQAYGRRLYLFKYVHQQLARGGPYADPNQTMLDISEDIDENLIGGAGLTLTQFYRKVKDDDPNTVSRQPRQR